MHFHKEIKVQGQEYCIDKCNDYITIILAKVELKYSSHYITYLESRSNHYITHYFKK